MNFANRKWVLKPYFSVSSAGSYLPAENISGLFKSNNTIFRAIKEENNRLYYTTMTGEDVLVYVFAGTWSNIAYRTILFVDEPTTSPGNLASFLDVYAEEELITYTVPGAALKEIADAIRAKTKDVQKYNFPYDFIAAINNIMTAEDVGVTKASSVRYIGILNVSLFPNEQKNIQLTYNEAVPLNYIVNTFKYDHGYVTGLVSNTQGTVQSVNLMGRQLLVNVTLINRSSTPVVVPSSASAVVGYNYYVSNR